jgi:vancomycin resistance protein YoaR
MSLRPVLLALFLLALAAGLATGVYTLRGHLYANQALPGVRVLGADVAGSGASEAAARIDRAAAPRLAAPVTVVAAGRRLSLVPGVVLRVDSTATAAAALQAGRGTVTSRALALLSPLPARRNVAPVLIVRRRAAGALFAKLDGYGQPASSATVTLDGLEPVVHPGRAGTRVDQQAFLDALGRHVATGRSTIVARYRRAYPRVSTAAATVAATHARSVLSAPVELRYAGAVLGSLQPERLARLLRFAPHGRTLDATFDRDAVATVVGPLVRPWRRPAVNARLAPNGTHVRLVPARPGSDLDLAATVSALAAATYGQTGRIANVTLAPVQPKVTTQELRKLGITRQLASFTTDMGVSSSNRIHNVHLMADFIAGTIVKPGEVFSFNKIVGPRTAQRGFLEGQEIIGTLVLPSIGGGVCQTATTLFNDAFETGLPILERTNHNLYLSHYPLGRDATVAWGGPDLVFRNDMRHGILITTSYTDQTLTFMFWGTPQGRRVVAETGPKENFKSPTMNYAIDPSAPANSVKVVSGSGAEGFSVTVQRTVYQGGKVLRRDSFRSTYIPEGSTTVYGPGGHPPGPYFVLPKV